MTWYNVFHTCFFSSNYGCSYASSLHSSICITQWTWRDSGGPDTALLVAQFCMPSSWCWRLLLSATEHLWSVNICSLLCLWFSPHSLLSCRPAKSSGRLGVVSKFWEWSSPSSNAEDTCTIGNLLTTLEHTSFSYYGIHATSSLASLITSLKETSAKACHMCPWYRPCLNTLNCWLHCPMICDKKQSLDANCYVWVAGVTSPGSSLGMPGPDRERWKFVWKTPEFQCSI